MRDRLGFVLVCFLAAIGIFVSVLPFIVPHEVHLAVARVLYGDYVPQIDRLAELSWTNAVHRLGGATWMALTPLQLLPAIRRRWPLVHRWTGRAWVLLTFGAALSGLIFTSLRAYSGAASTIPVLILFVYILISVAQAWRLAVRRDFAGHRRWVLRTVAAGLSIVSIRVVYLGLYWILGQSVHDAIITSFWMGIIGNLVLVEWWTGRLGMAIRARTRAPAA